MARTTSGSWSACGRARFEHGVGVRDPHPLEDQLAYFRSQVVPRYEVHVAVREGRIVGFAAFDAQSIGQLYVQLTRPARAAQNPAMCRAPETP